MAAAAIVAVAAGLSCGAADAAARSSCYRIDRAHLQPVFTGGPVYAWMRQWRVRDKASGKSWDFFKPETGQLFIDTMNMYEVAKACRATFVWGGRDSGIEMNFFLRADGELPAEPKGAHESCQPFDLQTLKVEFDPEKQIYKLWDGRNPMLYDGYPQRLLDEVLRVVESYGPSYRCSGPGGYQYWLRTPSTAAADAVSALRGTIAP